MWDLFKVAVRNVGRNKRRSLITIFTIFIGVLVVCGARGLLNGLQDEIRTTLSKKMHGDLQIHKAGYQQSIESSPFKVMFQYTKDMQRQIQSTGLVDDISPRLRLIGMLNHQRTQATLPVIIQAFDSEKELNVCPRIANSISIGKMMDSRKEVLASSREDENLEEAAFLEDGVNTDPAPVEFKNTTGKHQVMLSPSLFEGLGAEIGDEIVLLLQDKNSMQQALIANISGVLDYALPATQAKIMWMDYKTLANSLSLQDEVSELAISIKPGVDQDKAKKAIQEQIGNDKIAETYLELSGLFSQAIGVQNKVFQFVIFIVFSIVVSAIVNTSLMTVMERVREIGTLMALGYRRKHILLLFLSESAVIGLLGAVSALILTGIIMYILGTNGIVLTFPGQTSSTILYPRVTMDFLTFVMFLAIFSAVIAAFVPAYRASRMRPVDALNKS